MFPTLRDGLILQGCLIGWLFSTVTAAEPSIVQLRNGGQLVGDVVRVPAGQEESEVQYYIVKLSSGARVKLAARQVRKVIDPSPPESQYASLLRRMPDTAQGHLMMAEWCQENGLNDLRLNHLEQLLRHQPDHEDARRILGYGLIDGQWVRAQDWMEQQGYVRYQGAWRLPQQVAILEAARESELSEKQWRRDLKMWRGWLGGRRDAEAREEFQQLNDPLAISGLAALLSEEQNAQVREMYIDLLARFSDANAYAALIHVALEDVDLENRLRAVDHLRENGQRYAVQAFAQALGHKENWMVNRAAVALGRLGDPDAVLPLIHALITRHETLTQPTADIRPSFGGSRDGTGSFNGLSVGGGGPKRVVRARKNKDVLQALVSLTKQNYQYSTPDWMQWYVNENSSPNVNLRRDL